MRENYYISTSLQNVGARTKDKRAKRAHTGSHQRVAKQRIIGGEVRAKTGRSVAISARTSRQQAAARPPGDCAVVRFADRSAVAARLGGIGRDI